MLAAFASSSWSTSSLLAAGGAAVASQAQEPLRCGGFHPGPRAPTSAGRPRPIFSLSRAEAQASSCHNRATGPDGGRDAGCTPIQSAHVRKWGSVWGQTLKCTFRIRPDCSPKFQELDRVRDGRALVCRAVILTAGRANLSGFWVAVRWNCPDYVVLRPIFSSTTRCHRASADTPVRSGITPTWVSTHSPRPPTDLHWIQ